MTGLTEISLPEKFAPAYTERKNFRLVEYSTGEIVLLIRPTYHDLDCYLRNHPGSIGIQNEPSTTQMVKAAVLNFFWTLLPTTTTLLPVARPEFAGNLNEYLTFRYSDDIEKLRKQNSQLSFVIASDLSYMAFGYEGAQNYLPPHDIRAGKADFSGAYIEQMYIAPGHEEGVTLLNTYPALLSPPSAPQFKLSSLTSEHSEETLTHVMTSATKRIKLTHPKNLRTLQCFRTDENGTHWVACYSMTQSNSGKIALVKPCYNEIKAFIAEQKYSKQKLSLREFLHQKYHFESDVTIVPDLSGMIFGLPAMEVFALPSSDTLETNILQSRVACHYDIYDFSDLDLSGCKCVGTTFGPNAIFKQTNLSHMDAREALFDQTDLSTARMDLLIIGGQKGSKRDTLFLSTNLPLTERNKLALYYRQKTSLLATGAHTAKRVCSILLPQSQPYFDSKSRYSLEHTNGEGRAECQRAVGGLVGQLIGSGMGIYAASYFPAGGMTTLLSGCVVGGALGGILAEKMAYIAINETTGPSRYIDSHFGDDLAKLGCFALVAREAGIEAGKLGLVVGAFIGMATGSLQSTATIGTTSAAALASTAIWKELKKTKELLDKGKTPEQVVAEMRQARRYVSFRTLITTALIAVTVGAILVPILTMTAPISIGLSSVIGIFAAITTYGVGYGIARFQSDTGPAFISDTAAAAFKSLATQEEIREIAVAHPGYGEEETKGQRTHTTSVQTTEKALPIATSASSSNENEAEVTEQFYDALEEMNNATDRAQKNGEWENTQASTSPKTKVIMPTSANTKTNFVETTARLQSSKVSEALGAHRSPKREP